MQWVFVFETLIEGGYKNLKIAFHYEIHFLPSYSLSLVSFPPTLSLTIISSPPQTYSRLPTINQVIQSTDSITVNVLPEEGGEG